MLRPRLRAFAPLVLLGLAAACDGEPPPPSLRIQMFKVDNAEKEIAKAMSNPSLFPSIANHARTIASIAADASFERYEKKPSYRLPAAELEKFRSFRGALGERARALEAAATAGDAGAVARGYAQLQFLCQTCHASFRPGL